MRKIRRVLVLFVAMAIAMLAVLALPQSTSTAEAQGDFTCEVVDDVLSWSDQGVDRYQLRRIVPGGSLFFTTVQGATSLDLPGTAAFYVVQARIDGTLTKATCAGNPARPFSCSVTGNTLSWTNQNQDAYQIRRVAPGGSIFLATVPDSTSMALTGTANFYVVQTNNYGVLTKAACAGNPAPAFTCSVDGELLSWSDQNQSNYNIRQTINGNDSFVGLTSDLSLPVSGTADTYTVRSSNYGDTIEATCAGTPLPEFTCSVDGEVLSWTDQNQGNYNIRQSSNGNDTFVGSTDQLSIAVTGAADTYTVRTNIFGMSVSATCDGNPPASVQLLGHQ